MNSDYSYNKVKSWPYFIVKPVFLGNLTYKKMFLSTVFNKMEEWVSLKIQVQSKSDSLLQKLPF